MPRGLCVGNRVAGDASFRPAAMGQGQVSQTSVSSLINRAKPRARDVSVSEGPDFVALRTRQNPVLALDSRDDRSAPR